MAEENVCLITGAAGTIGQRILADLVASKHKIIALCDTSDMSYPEVLRQQKIKATTSLPVTAQAFLKNDVQFCFGDIADISFLASVFNSAAANGIKIECVLHLAPVTKKTFMHDGTANLVEVCRAYWQSSPDTFKGFLYAAPEGDLIRKFAKRDDFPVTFYRLRQNLNSAPTVKSDTLYRMFTPLETSFVKKYQNNLGYMATPANKTDYIKELSKAVTRLLAS